MHLRIKKKLSANDTGENGSHQAGLLIPKKTEYLSFFPKLEIQKLNPFAWIEFKDDSDMIWKFKFIYYNNKIVGNGTRNEYRLTCMTAFFRKKKIKAGDTIIFENIGNVYSVLSEKSHLKIESSEIWEVEFI